MRLPRLARLIALGAAAVAALAACSSSDDGAEAGKSACVQVPSADCKPLVDPPTYDAIYAQILRPTCASAVTCHASGSVLGGLSFASADESHAMLVGQNGPRVVAGDPSCSPLMERIMSSDPSYRMPRGSTPLSDAETCAITKWIANGAQR